MKKSKSIKNTPVGFPLLENIDEAYELIHPDDVKPTTNAINEAIETGGDYESEFRLVNPANGEAFWFHAQGALSNHTGDGLPRFVGITQNITERKRAEESLRFQAHLLNTIEQAAIATDLDGKIIYWNKFAEKLYGWTAKEAVNRNIAELTTPEIMAEQADEIMLQLRQGKSWTGEFTVRRRDGTTFPAQIVDSPIADGQGNLIGIVGVSHDITMRKQSEQALRDSEVRFRAMFEQANVGIVQLSFDGQFLMVNPGFCKIVGYSAKECRNLKVSDITHAEDYKLEDAENQRLLSDEISGYTLEKRYLHKNGGIVWGTMTATIVRKDSGEPIYMLSIVEDITDRKAAEESLRESEERYRTLFESIDEGFCVVEMIFDRNEKPVDYRFTEMNPAFEQHTGIVRGLGKRARELIPNLEDFWFEIYGRVALTGKAVRFESYAEPMNRWFDVYASRVGDETSRKVAIVFKNITEGKRAEEKLRESEERLRLMIESATDFAIIRITSDNLIASWNKGAQKVFGYTESEIIGQSGEILFTPEDREKGVPRKEIETALEKGRAEDERWHIRKDGSRFFASGVMMQLREGAVGFVKIARDQTEKIAAEKAVRDKEMLQKLIGTQEDERKRIARDLHDELGQKLTALRLKLEAVRKICEEDEICGGIDEAQRLAKHIDADVDFLAWELRPAALDDLGLLAALDNYVNEWSRHSGVTSGFHVSGLKRERLVPEVETNLYRITQEALNNTHKHAKATRIDVILEKRDGSVILIIEDDGKGFNVKDKKNKSKGFGLIGMQERAALVGGTLEIESAPKQGTTIFVRIPATFVKKEKEPEN